MIVYFPHIPKTGGQTLHQAFYKAFGFNKCIKVWNPNFGADVAPDKFYSLNRKHFEGISAIIGHLPVSIFLKNSYAKSEFEKGNVQIVTSVRDPIKRIISSYNYILYNEKHPEHEKVKNISPIDFIMHRQANFQFNYLKPKVESNIDDIYQIMNIFPMENSITELTNFFANNFNINLESIEIINKSINWANGRKNISVDDISDDALADLKKIHQIDFDLYYKSFNNC